MIHDLPWSEKLDFVDKSKVYTKRLATNIVEQVLNSNIHSVAKRNDLSDEIVQSLPVLCLVAFVCDTSQYSLVQGF